MAKISVIGIAGNSIFMNVDHFHQKGETLQAKAVFEEIGGKGFNQAVACAKMGAEVSFLCAVGEDDFAVQCKKTAEEYGIDADFITKKGKRTTFAVILTDKNGENQVTGYRDAELCAEDVDLFSEKIANSDILLLQNEVPESVNEAAVNIAKEHGVKVILNPAPIRSLSDNIAQNVFLVTPNEQEQSAINASRFKNVVTTLGEKGCLINGKTAVKALKVNAVDTTGAGDTFNGVLAVCLAEKKDLETACKYAVTASGISVIKKGVLNAIPTIEQIERKMLNE